MGENGQTIIETMVAVFILMTGILSIFALSQDTNTLAFNIKNQNIGTGLAREGIEAIKNIRDTNWLVASELPASFKTSDQLVTTVISGNPLASISTKVHTDWLNPSIAASKYVLESGTLLFDHNTLDMRCGESGTDLTRNLLLENNTAFAGYMNTPPSTVGLYWVTDATGQLLRPKTGSVADAFQLRFSDYTYQSANKAVYYRNAYRRDGTNNVGTPSSFYRAICIKKYSNKQPFSTSDYGPLIEVVSRVWWRDTYRCKTSFDANNYTYDRAGSACKIQLKMFLTNWKPD